MSWGFPLIHVAVPFSSVLQVLFIILGSKPPYLCREESGITIKFWGELTTWSWKMPIFYTLSICKTEVGNHIVYVKGMPITSLLWKTPWYRQLWLLSSLIWTLQYRFLCHFNSKSPWQKNHNPQTWVYLYINPKFCHTYSVQCTSVHIQYSFNHLPGRQTSSRINQDKQESTPLFCLTFCIIYLKTFLSEISF